MTHMNLTIDFIALDEPMQCLHLMWAPGRSLKPPIN